MLISVIRNHTYCKVIRSSSSLALETWRRDGIVLAQYVSGNTAVPEERMTQQARKFSPYSPAPTHT